MGSSFDRGRFFANVNYLLKQSGMKVGDLEKAANVSTGYISRTSKDGNTKPGIDFIMGVANTLCVDVDTLLTADLAALTPTEKYLIQFIEKMITDTKAGTIWWDQETAKFLNCQLGVDYDGFCTHPLFDMIHVHREDSDGNEINFLFSSHAFKDDTIIGDDCFNVSLKNGAKFYLMSIQKCVDGRPYSGSNARELWACPRHGTPEFLCDNLSFSRLSIMMDNLYNTVSKSVKGPRIKGNIYSLIEAYMNDSIDDDDDEIPF